MEYTSHIASTKRWHRSKEEPEKKIPSTTTE
jgi:hypothetical protein